MREQEQDDSNDELREEDHGDEGDGYAPSEKASGMMSMR